MSLGVRVLWASLARELESYVSPSPSSGSTRVYLRFWHFRLRPLLSPTELPPVLENYFDFLDVRLLSSLRSFLSRLEGVRGVHCF